MKRVLICLASAILIFQSCNKDDNETIEVIKEVDNITEQNANDDKAIAVYMDEHYLDEQGLIQDISTTNNTTQTKLSSLDWTKLDSGVIVIKRQGAQPSAQTGVTIGNTDVIRLMGVTDTFLSKVNDDGTIDYASNYTFRNTISGTGNPEVDPYYYYVKKAVLENTANTEDQKKRSYYEIEGFQEGLRQFKSFNQDDSALHNLQGVIIVPSRAAYARDAHYTSTYRNRSFVFNFQVYKSTARPASAE